MAITLAISASITYSRRTLIGFFLALALTLTGGASVNAAVLYDFSLAQNGDVGPVHVIVRTSNFLLPDGLLVFDVTDSAVREASAGVPIDPTSVVGLDFLATSTLFGVSFYEPDFGPLVLLTRDYPADFFVFARTPTQTGTFLSTSGVVDSDSGLDTRRPVATLVVTQVPEPATMSLLGLASLAAIARRRRQRLD